MVTHVSYSQFSEYTRCAKAYQLKRIQGAPQTPSVWLPAGKALHSTFEAINRAALAAKEGK